MSDDGLNEFFNNLFGGEGGEFTPPPPPTDEELCAEAMKVTDAHLVAYYAATESITSVDIAPERTSVSAISKACSPESG